MSYRLEDEGDTVRITFSPPRWSRLMAWVNAAWTSAVALALVIVALTRGLSGFGVLALVVFAAFAVLSLASVFARESVVLACDGRRFHAVGRPTFWSLRPAGAVIGVVDSEVRFGRSGRMSDSEAESLAKELNDRVQLRCG